MKIKNPIKIIKSTKEPVKTIQDLEMRKKDVKQWLIISGVLCIIGIGFFGLLAFGLINFALNKIAKKFELLTCKNCGKMASFSNIEEFKKYITYNTLRYKAEYNGISHPRSNDGIVSYVEAKGSAIAIVNISLTCPHCGAVKKLRYYTTPFKCSDSQEKVNVRDVELVKSRLEKSVKEVVDIYNDSQRHHEIPYSTDSIHHPDYDHENRLKLQFKKDTYYNGVKIVCHREVEEIVEGYFLYDDLHGKMEDLNENSKLKDNESKPQGDNVKDETFKLEGESEVIQTSLDDSSEHTFLKEGQCEVVNNQNKNLNQTSNNNILENLDVLKKLKELLDLGVITQKEFEEKKILLLDIGVKKQEMQSTKQNVNTATKSQKKFEYSIFY